VYVRSLHPGAYGTGPVFWIEKLGAVCVPLPEHAGRSLLWHPTNRSQTINGSSVVKVVHRLADGFGCDVPPVDMLLG
jgi:hypothetical protein